MSHVYQTNYNKLLFEKTFGSTRKKHSIARSQTKKIRLSLLTLLSKHSLSWLLFFINTRWLKEKVRKVGVSPQINQCLVESQQRERTLHAQKMLSRLLQLTQVGYQEQTQIDPVGLLQPPPPLLPHLRVNQRGQPQRIRLPVNLRPR
jgi:hypothetical protein